MNKLNVGIFAHIDAGKTTLTERLLLLAGEIRHAGSVDGGTSATDFLPVERRRGISVRDASVTLHAYGAEIHIIDTPGHADFIEETELALGAIDVAVLVLSATEGVQAQTELLLSAIRRRKLPIVIFYNKCDREPSPPLNALKKLCNAELLAFDAPDFTENALTALGDEELLSAYLDGKFDENAFWRQLDEALMRGEIYPLLFGSARTGEKCDLLLKILARYTCPRDETAPFSAYIYQITHHKTFGKLAHVRILTGSLAMRGEVPNRRTQSIFKATQLKFVQGEKLTDTSILKAGDVGAVAGLADARAGDCLGEESGLPAPSLASPYLRVKITPQREEALPAVKAALEELTDESPSLALEWVREKRELIVSAAGTVQMEILRDTMSERYGLNVDMGTPSVVYRETPVKAAYGFEAYTMPKPCWAVVRFYLRAARAHARAIRLAGDRPQSHPRGRRRSPPAHPSARLFRGDPDGRDGRVAELRRPPFGTRINRDRLRAAGVARQGDRGDFSAQSGNGRSRRGERAVSPPCRRSRRRGDGSSRAAPLPHGRKGGV